VGDAIAAVFVAHVIDHFAAAAHAKIDIEVGRRNAFGIEEALEQEAESHRVNVGDAEQIGDETAGAGTTTWADGNAVLLGPVNEIPHDEKVVDEPRNVNDRLLVTEADGEFLRLGEAGIIRRLWFFARG